MPLVEVRIAQRRAVSRQRNAVGHELDPVERDAACGHRLTDQPVDLGIGRSLTDRLHRLHVHLRKRPARDYQRRREDAVCIVRHVGVFAVIPPQWIEPADRARQTQQRIRAQSVRQQIERSQQLSRQSPYSGIAIVVRGIGASWLSRCAAA